LFRLNLLDVCYSVSEEEIYNYPRPLMVVMNHIHRLDYVFVASALPFIVNPVVAFDVITNHKILSFIVRTIGGITNPIIVYRHKEKSNLPALIKAINRLRAGEVILIAPEGHRIPGDCVGEIKPGAALIALKANAYILPVATKINNITSPNPLIQVKIGKPFKLRPLNEFTNINDSVITSTKYIREQLLFLQGKPILSEGNNAI
jgi:1-acyl-sn-glycerol-3-phosphate acyltransferase